MILIFIRQAIDLNLNLHTGSLVLCLVVFLSPSGNCYDSTSNYVTTASFHIVSNPLFMKSSDQSTLYFLR
jgi:hypothetical protein